MDGQSKADVGARKQEDEGPATRSPPHLVTPSPCHPVTGAPSGWRAWLYLVWLSWQRQARARQMVWIALGLLTLAVTLTALNTAIRGWGLARWTYIWLWVSQQTLAGVPSAPGARALGAAVLGSADAVVGSSAFVGF